MEKITYITALNFAIDTINEALDASGSVEWDEKAHAAIDKLTALRDQTAKRNSAERKPTKVQVENERLKEVVLGILTDESQTVTEIMAKDNRLSALSNQKVSALVNALVDDGKALKVPVGRKSTFRRA